MHHLPDLAQFKKLLDKFDTFLFDCDGVLWRGNELIPGSKEFVDKIRKAGKDVIFVTNNASNSRNQYKQKFDQLGFKVDVDEIFSSAYASAVYLKYNLKFPSDKKVFVVGMSGLEEELDSEGIKRIGGTDPAYNKLAPHVNFKEIKQNLDKDVGAVIAGFDIMLNYTKLSYAHSYLTSPEHDVKFIFTNDDSTFPQACGVFPGSGAMSSPLAVSSKRTPTVVGKPNAPMLECILKKKQLKPERTLMIGDRLNTDIAFGQHGNVKTMLVLSGVCKKEDIIGEGIYPDYIAHSLGHIH
ncbi:hypothetical protein E3P86_02018 [Wallemia ichthyophaga]|uniref:4-nitrophenylphosphatase n=1 Tax=Wallemia ichthyophaga TaxID=245174 RepID=A0A4T0J8I8_WALIC|nr:hypothetical protein E3P86_02018 [Wallemia ichthyophaga]